MKAQTQQSTRNAALRARLGRFKHRVNERMHTLPEYLLENQHYLRDAYAIGSIFTLPLALISTIWLKRGDSLAPDWAITVAFITCLLAFLCYAAALCDLALIPRRYSLAGTKRESYIKLINLDEDLKGIVQSLRAAKSSSGLNPRGREEMQIDFAYFLHAHARRTKRALLGVVLLSMLCIIMAFSSVYIAIYTMEPESIPVENAEAMRGGIGWILYGLECSLENVTSLGKHSDASPLAKLSAIVESITFFFLITVILSVFLDLTREAAEITDHDLMQELERDLGLA